MDTRIHGTLVALLSYLEVGPAHRKDLEQALAIVKVGEEEHEARVGVEVGHVQLNVVIVERHAEDVGDDHAHHHIFKRRRVDEPESSLPWPRLWLS